MLTLLLTLAGCGTGSVWHESPLWDVAPVAATDGLYIALPDANELVRVKPDGTWSPVDLGGSQVERMILTPNQDQVVVFATYPTCDLDDPELLTFDDCEEADGEVVWEKELIVLSDGAIQGEPIPYEGHFNQLTFTHGGAAAVAWTDLSDGSIPELTGLDNLTEIAIVDLTNVRATPVAVGDLVDSIHFSEDDARALILSRSEVIVLDMTGEYEREVTFPLTLDVDEAVRPTSVVLTPDGRYAMLTVQYSADLYVLDLEPGNQSINIVSMAAVPSQMKVSTSAERTAIVYASRAELDILEHDYFEVEAIDLEEPSTDLIVTDGQVLAFNTANTSVKDVYRVDLSTGELTEYRAENPLRSLELAPDGLKAVGVALPEGGFSTGIDGLLDSNWGITLFDMASDESLHLIASAEPIGLAFRGEGPDAEALVLLEGLDELLQVDLTSGTDSSVDLEAPPQAIGAIGDKFWITHDVPLGMVAFVSADGTQTIANGFATVGLLPSEDLLVHKGE